MVMRERCGRELRSTASVSGARVSSNDGARRERTSVSLAPTYRARCSPSGRDPSVARHDARRLPRASDRPAPASGCSKVLAGLCALLRGDVRRALARHPWAPYEQGFDLRLWPGRLEQPLRWTRPAHDLRELDERPVPRGHPGRVTSHAVFEVMVRAEHHTFQVLTKRHERLAELAPDLPWPDNVWMGVTIENRRFVHRADYLRRRAGGGPLHLRRAAARSARGPRPHATSTGSSRAARAGRSIDPSGSSGCASCATAARTKASRTSSSSGAVGDRRPAAANSMAAHGTRCRSRSEARSSRSSTMSDLHTAASAVCVRP